MADSTSFLRSRPLIIAIESGVISAPDERLLSAAPVERKSEQPDQRTRAGVAAPDDGGNAATEPRSDATPSQAAGSVVSAPEESGNIPSSLPLFLLPARPGMSFRATGPWRVVCPSWGAPLVRS
jgi:hypothetical protein